MGTELTTITKAGFLQMPPTEQGEIVMSLHTTIKHLLQLEKDVHQGIIENAIDVPGCTICKGRTKTDFALDDQATAIEIHAIAEQMGIAERTFLRPKSPAELKKIMGSAIGQQLFIETTGEPTIRIKKEDA